MIILIGDQIINWMMTLPKDLEREFQQELKQYEEGKKMPYITSIERAGQLKGQLEVNTRFLYSR